MAECELTIYFKDGIVQVMHAKAFSIKSDDLLVGYLTFLNEDNQELTAVSHSSVSSFTLRERKEP